MTKKEVLALIPVCGVAVLLRLWGIGFGLPYDFHPDEPTVIETAFRMASSGDLNPHFFTWPSLFFYLNALSYWFFFLFGKVCGFFPSLTEFYAYYVLAPSLFILIPRFLSALCGALSTIPLYLLGKHLGHPKVGWLAATLLAVSPLHVENSHFGTVDITLTLGVLLATYFLYLSSRYGNRRDFLLFGLTSGLATATKYPAGLLIVALVLLSPLLVTQSNGTPESQSPRFVIGSLILSLSVFAVAFFLVAPYTILDFPTFWRHFVAESTGVSREWLGGETVGSRFAFYARLLLVNEFSFLAGILCLGGIARFGAQHRRTAFVLLVFPLLYYWFFGASANVHARFALPLLPTVALFTAYGVWWLSNWQVFKQRSLHSAVFFLVALGLWASSGVWAVRINQTFGQKDTRILAKEWIEAHIPSGTRMVTEYYGPPLRDFQQERQRSQARNLLWRQESWTEWITRNVPASHPFYYVVVIPVSRPRTMEEVARTFYSLAHYVADGTEYIIVDSNMMSRYRAAPEKYPLQTTFYSELEQQGELIQVWNPQEISCSGPEIKLYRVPRAK